MKYIKQDITETDLPYILHGCNCMGVMGSGVAGAIRFNFPNVYTAYKNQEEREGLSLGGFSVSRESTPRIVNLLTQKGFGSDGAVYADAIAIRSSVRSFIDSEFPGVKASIAPVQLAIPKIGCGLGGLQWKHVEQIFHSIESDYNHMIQFTVYEI